MVKEYMCVHKELHSICLTFELFCDDTTFKAQAAATGALKRRRLRRAR